MDSNSAFDLLKEEMENEDVFVIFIFLDYYKSKRDTQSSYSNGFNAT